VADLVGVGADSVLAMTNVHNHQVARVWWQKSHLWVMGMFHLDDRWYGGRGQQLLGAACTAHGHVHHRRWRGRDDWIADFTLHLEAFEGRGETAVERWFRGNAAPRTQRIAGSLQYGWEQKVRYHEARN
jgi:hypothetical protein